MKGGCSRAVPLVRRRTRRGHQPGPRRFDSTTVISGAFQRNAPGRIERRQGRDLLIDAETIDRPGEQTLVGHHPVPGDKKGSYDSITIGFEYDARLNGPGWTT